jgi:BirA family transcriptional regulator, biotin operon repressor / biotin---[acetyl-CoA-carboxylase] ligase
VDIEPTNEAMILAFLAEGGEEFVSGATLSDKLGLSRAAVWKHVEGLRGLGYRIDAQPAKGYRLLQVPDRLTELEVGPLLATRDVGRVLHHFESCGSTNAEAFTLAQEGAFHGEVVVAETQTAGRGRRGRSWVSPPGLNVYTSIVVRPEVPPARAPELTLVAAVAAVETLRDAQVNAAIKWPNDLVVGKKKIAGILTELAADAERVQFAVVGVGINLNVDPRTFSSELASLATSAIAERGQDVPRALFVAAFLSNFERWYDLWLDEGFGPVRDAWRTKAQTLGQPVVVKQEPGEWRGVAEDIDESGALLVRTESGLRRVLAGDVEHLTPS